ncbi:hypothetical protein DVK85_07105 [Flavobacterium arcticum]|uniref:Uncharacterized protein n=1 Tax=Flavobacterium arcticum TaxID=1784713 RepID=A0A345HBR4_9FLAO|nr:hypothetical protein [Flavobacterium arcticum]AXG74024.1 hypothetical protein DVK85_07105 [Flavobacterium arcticum]KAF2509002.1 hypothetical protein E0W72_10590 [Flavobacterium arcticum]
MKELFKEIAEKYNGFLSISEDKWFNGHTYLPVYLYDLDFSYRGWDFMVRHEFRSSEFSKSGAIGLDTFSDRHLFDIKVTAKNVTLPDFEVLTKGFFAKIFAKSESKNFKVKSRDKNFIEQLFNNTELIDIYKSTDSEFSPELYGVGKKGSYMLTVRYTTQQKRIELLKSMISFITKFPEIKT